MECFIVIAWIKESSEFKGCSASWANRHPALNPKPYARYLGLSLWPEAAAKAHTRNAPARAASQKVPAGKDSGFGSDFGGLHSSSFSNSLGSYLESYKKKKKGTTMDLANYEGPVFFGRGSLHRDV